MKKITSLLLSFILVFSLFVTANAANELAGAKNYTLGSSKSGSILEGDESDIYSFELSNPAKTNINLSANIVCSLNYMIKMERNYGVNVHIGTTQQRK